MSDAVNPSATPDPNCASRCGCCDPLLESRCSNDACASRKKRRKDEAVLGTILESKDVGRQHKEREGDSVSKLAPGKEASGTTEGGQESGASLEPTMPQAALSVTSPLKAKPFVIDWKDGPIWKVTEAQRGGELEPWTEKVIDALIARVDSTRCHVTKHPWDCYKLWEDVRETLRPLLEPAELTVGLCRLQYEWLMVQFRSARTACNVFESLSTGTLDLMVKLKEQEDEFRGSCA